jgi:competence protein ComEA
MLHEYMQGFLDSFTPLFTRYKSEIVLLGVAFIVGTVSLVVFLQQKNGEKQTPVITIKDTNVSQVHRQTITVDVSGAVKNPFVYTLPSNARIIDAIQKAGGLTEEADVAFVKRNINYARFLSDQEKIYIPYLTDTNSGAILENKRIIDYTQPNMGAIQTEVSSTLININTASSLELDQLPGVGQVNADAIVNGRPYTTTEDLIKNNIIKQSTYDKIKDLVSVY